MKKITQAIFTYLLLSLFINTPALAETLDAEQVKALFSGKTVDSQHLKKDKAANVYYDPNGQFYGMRDDSIFQGDWKVQDNGEICLTFNKRKTRCRPIRKIDGVYYKSKVKGNGDIINIVEFKGFTDGNPNSYKFVD